MLALGPADRADRAVRTSVHSAAVTYGCGIVEDRQLTRATQANPSHARLSATRSGRL